MARERYQTRSGTTEEAFDTSLMYDDIERIRDQEQEQERTENDKYGFAGMMSLVAGIGLIVLGVLGTTIGGDLTEFLTVVLNVAGFGAIGYGFIKILRLAFRRRELEFPTLNVYRKARPRARESRPESQTRTSSQSQNNSTTEQTYTPYERRRYRRRRRRSGRQKSLHRSRTDRVFSGVAGGIAEYTGVSAALIRFAFIFATFMTSGMFLFPYLLLSIVLPTDLEERTTEDSERGGRTSSGGGRQIHIR